MMGIVMPLGVLFRGGAEGTIRKHLIDNGSICAVVGLAGGLFYFIGNLRIVQSIDKTYYKVA